MNLKVIDGRLAETPVGAGVERRAFGEFVGPHGELASYAFVARLTVGVGAGNPGGASFHAIIFRPRARPERLSDRSGRPLDRRAFP